MKNYKGKAIYQPAGKAAEYAKWACNFYTGCSNGCEYCYLKKGRGAKILGGDKPSLKKCFKDETHALEVFKKELKENLPELQKHGLFFSFTTDPMLPETAILAIKAAHKATEKGVPVKILSKIADWVDEFIKYADFFEDPETGLQEWRRFWAFGFTLTGHDELEPGASTNQERIEAMKKLHDAGFKTFASIEPIIDVKSSYRMVEETLEFCDLYKIGPESGKKYSINDVRELFASVNILLACRSKAKVYWKDGYLKLLNTNREYLLSSCTVDRDYNIFNQ